MRTDFAPLPARNTHNVSSWLARRWYYTPKTHRAYSVRQVAPGDRRLLAEFAISLGQATTDREIDVVQELSTMVFDRVLSPGNEMAVGFAALEATAAGDRIIGVAAYAPDSKDDATFSIAVASTFREEEVGRILLATLIRNAKRVGIRRLSAEMHWSNRAMQRLAQSSGFTVEALAGDRGRRKLLLTLK
jgi:RimJ/RimL family protein N-acetyltransferase